MTNKAQEVKSVPSPHAKNLSGDNLAGQDGEEIVGNPLANTSWVTRPGGELALPLAAGRGSRTPPHPGAAGRGSVGRVSRGSWPWPRSPSSGPTCPLWPRGALVESPAPGKSHAKRRAGAAPAGLPCARDPGPWGPRTPPARRGYFRKSEIKDGWRSGPERLGRRSAGGVARGGRKSENQKPNSKRGKYGALLSHLLGPSSPLRGAGGPHPRLLGVGRGRAPSPPWPGRGACNRSPSPGGSSQGVPLLEPPRKAPRG